MTDPWLPDELVGTLKEIERRLRWSDALDVALRTAALALAVSILLSLLGPMLEVGSARLLLLLSAAVVLLPTAGAFGYGLTQRRTILHVARICDRRLGLKERLSTALEVTMVDSQGALVEAQLLDT